MASSAQPGSVFPESLEEVAAAERIPESLGYLPGYLGVLSLCGTLPLLLDRTTVWDAVSLGIVAGGAVIGLPLLWYEWRRRKNRTVLVPRSGMVAVYRKRRLAQVIEAGAITPHPLNFMNHIHLIVLPGLFGLVLLGAPLIAGKMPSGDTWALPIIGALVLVAVASGVRTRIFLKHFFIPKRKWREEILLSGDNLSRLIEALPASEPG